jgi:hypothetical protein
MGGRNENPYAALLFWRKKQTWGLNFSNKTIPTKYTGTLLIQNLALSHTTNRNS